MGWTGHVGIFHHPWPPKLSRGHGTLPELIQGSSRHSPTIVMDGRVVGGDGIAGAPRRHSRAFIQASQSAVMVVVMRLRLLLMMMVMVATPSSRGAQL